MNLEKPIMTACRGKEALHTWKDKPASWANCAHRPTGSRRAPVGDSWYDSLQMKLNMRLKYGFSALATQYMTRVLGQPLYLVDPNGHIDPTKQLILNPAAWEECSPTATFGARLATPISANGGRRRKISP
jgi:hypothetical protein